MLVASASRLGSLSFGQSSVCFFLRCRPFLYRRDYFENAGFEIRARISAQDGLAEASLGYRQGVIVCLSKVRYMDIWVSSTVQLL